MRTCASLFSGGGLAEVGLRAAGLMPLWGVEYDPAIASVYAANHDPHILVGDVRGVDFATLARPDLLWASPPCPSFSVAKTDRGETETDREIAQAVIRALTTLRPAAFILENVEGYVHSDSYRAICAALDGLDYWRDAEVVNAADLGTPQTRRRLILRARAGGWMQAHRPWPAPVRWRGWYGAIADLVPTLPDSAFAPWQLARLPAELRETLLVGGSNTSEGKAAEGVGVSRAAEPARAVPADISPTRYRAFILDGQESGAASGLTLRPDAAPMFTVTSGTGTTRPARAWLDTSIPQDARDEVDRIHDAGWARAFLMRSDNSQQEITPERQTRDEAEPAPTIRVGMPPRALVPPGRVVAMTPRALARFQGLPDTYVLPEKKALACRVIGNGVSVDVARVAAETLL